MQDLEHALSEIATIRGQMARAAEFRGYGPATLALTALLAGVAALGQPHFVPQPLRAPGTYVAYWSVAAALAASLIAAEAVARTRRLHGGLADEMIHAAVEQFMPSAAAGVLLSLALLRYAPASVPLLPGLWQMLFALGVFASCRFLPRPTLAVGIWYLGCGLWTIALSAGAHPLAPWMMGAPFFAGQGLAAAVLWRTTAAAPEEAR